MLDFKSFIKEELVPFSGFVLARNQMPQIKNIKHFHNFVDQLGIQSDLFTSNVEPIKPTQFEYDDKKVANIINDGDTSKPIVVSDDNFVLDGHHRYFAAKYSKVEIPILKIALPINKLLKLAYEYVEQYD